jgi:hypothetical protein
MMSKVRQITVYLPPDVAERLDLALFNRERALGPGGRITRSAAVVEILDEALPPLPLKVRTRTPPIDQIRTRKPFRQGRAR